MSTFVTFPAAASGYTMFAMEGERSGNISTNSGAFIFVAFDKEFSFLVSGFGVSCGKSILLLLLLVLFRVLTVSTWARLRTAKCQPLIFLLMHQIYSSPLQTAEKGYNAFEEIIISTVYIIFA